MGETEPKPQRPRCPECEGSAKCTWCEGQGRKLDGSRCVMCAGSGVCATCHGTGLATTPTG